MNTTLLVNISGQTYQRLDIFEDIPIQLVIQQSDVTDISQRKTPYSKVVQLPGTNNNDLVFEHYFEVNGIDFNPLNKIPCVVQYRGTDIFNGVMRLQSVIQKSNERIYEVYLLGGVADVASEMRNYNLQELTWTDLLHDYSYDNVVLSWEAKSYNQDGLFNGDILYPMINYGLKYSGSSTTPQTEYSFGQPNSFDQITKPLTVDMFKPSIRIKKVVDRIFETIGFEYQSDFFNTNYFKSIYMDMFQNGNLGVNTASASTNQNIFLVKKPQQNIVYRGNRLVEIPFFDTLPGTYDPLDNWIQPGSYFRVPYPGDYYFNFRFNLDSLDPTMFNANIRIRAYKSTDPNNISGGTMFYQSDTFNLNFGNNEEVNLFFSGSVLNGEYIKLYVDEGGPPFFIGVSSAQRQYLLRPYDDGVIVDTPYLQFDLYNSPTLSGQEIVDVSLGIQNINAFDFMKSLILMFNLMVFQDEDSKLIRIEPYNSYYNDPDRPEKDWTRKLDTDSDMRVEPLSFDLRKEVNWSYENTENEYLNKLFFDRNDFVFGREKFVSSNNIFQGENDYVIPFGPVPTSGVTGNDNFIIPQCYYLNNGLQTPYSTKTHLFFWNGNRYVDNFGTTNPLYPSLSGRTYYILSGITSVPQTTYPCVSHLSNLDIQIPELVSDLNFQSTFDFFGNTNPQITQFTPYNLFNSFWRDYIENLYSPETRRLTCKVFFTPIDIYDTTLKDKVFIKDSWYTIEKINEADLVNRKITEVNLIKDRVPVYEINPPSPIYPLSGNTPYPSVEPLFYTPCYTGTDKTGVCNGTSTIQNVYTFGTGILNNFDKVYYDTGTQLKLFPMGTYIRETSGSVTYVVADIYGRILEQYC